MIRNTTQAVICLFLTAMLTWLLSKTTGDWTWNILTGLLGIVIILMVLLEVIPKVDTEQPKSVTRTQPDYPPPQPKRPEGAERCFFCKKTVAECGCSSPPPICPDCNGTGQVYPEGPEFPKECKTCGGSGVVQ